MQLNIITSRLMVGRGRERARARARSVSHTGRHRTRGRARAHTHKYTEIMPVRMREHRMLTLLATLRSQ